MSKNSYTIFEYDHRFDASLAEMWNESDEQWPGTFTNGVPLNEERVKEWMDRVETIICFVVVEEQTGKVVGYGDLWDSAVRPNSCYVALLNVHPEHQGRSLARKMLVRMVNWAVENNYDRITIGTWPANLKAMPLYKKVGFFWKPDTNVYMENYLPAARLLPAAQPYFENHDWYSTYDRDLEQVEDGSLHPCTGDMKVYSMRWQDGDEYLETVYDRNAQSLTGIETMEWAAYARTGESEPGLGIRYPFEWEFYNKTDRPLHITLQAIADAGIDLVCEAEFDLQPKSNRVIHEAFKVLPAAPKYRGHHEDVRTPLVHTKLQMNGTPLELGTGLRYQPSLEISMHPVETTLTPGVSQKVQIQLKNNTKLAIEGKIALDLPPGLSADWADNNFSAPAEGFAGLSVRLKAERGGFFPLKVNAVTEQTGVIKPKLLPVMALMPGQWAAGVGDEELVLENDFFRIAAKARAGEAIIFNKGSNEEDARLMEEIGPPFVPWDLHEQEYELHLKVLEREARAIMTVRSSRFPGLVVSREITVNASPLIRVRGWVTNNTESDFDEMVLRPHLHVIDENKREVAVPLQEGIVLEHGAQFGGADEDFPKDPDRYDETWIAYHDKGQATGIIWPEGTMKELLVQNGRHFMLFAAPLAAGETHRNPDLYIYSGPGDWRALQQIWRQLSGEASKRLPILAEDDVRSHLDIYFDSAPLYTLNSNLETRMKIETTREYRLEGMLAINPPDGWQMNQKEIPFSIDEANPHEQFVRMKTNDKLPVGPYEGQISFESQAFDLQKSFRVFRLGDDTKSVSVTIEDSDEVIYSVSNGHSQWHIAPEFHAGVIAWHTKGASANQLLSSYPDEGEWSWMKPFFGGIRPMLFDLVADEGWPGKLQDETFSAAPVEKRDPNGLTWKGVRLKTDMKDKRFSGVQVEIEYLTLPGSNILKTVFRLINNRPVFRKVQYGWLAFANVDDTYTNSVIHTLDYTRKRTPHGSWGLHDKWAAIENPDSGKTLTAIPASGKRMLHAIDMGTFGAHLFVRENTDIPPLSSVEQTAYFTSNESIEQARMYIDLGKEQSKT